MKKLEIILAIKSLYDDGKGLSMRKIAKELNLSRNTIAKYITLDNNEISSKIKNTQRRKKLDKYALYIQEMLSVNSESTAQEIRQKLSEQFGSLAISERTFRRYLSYLKKSDTISKP